jgi:hypothetical protein
MHKLRSMTETIKMLSKENESLRGENDDLLRQAKNSSIDDNHGGKHGGKTHKTNTVNLFKTTTLGTQKL